MKKIFTTLAVVLLTVCLFSQAPQKMSYQAVVRNADGALMQNSKIGLKISLLRGSASGTLVYSETHKTETNANGLVSVVIGEGTSSTDNIASIDWSNGPYFIKTETDPAGETNYTITGTSELLSVPFALYAANGGMAAGSAAGNTPYWNGSAWITNNSNIFNNGKNIGIGTTTPASRFDIAGENNWDLLNGEGDFRIGNPSYRLKMGVALGGGGAGAATIMQHGQPGGYNVLSLGAQGNNILYLNGSNQSVGIGINTPNAPLGFPATIGKKITLYPGATGDVGFAVGVNRLQIYSDNPNSDVAFGYDAAGTFNEKFAVKSNGALALNGNTGTAGQIIQSNGSGGATYDFPVKTYQWGLPYISDFSSTTETNIFTQSFSTQANSTLVISVQVGIAVYCLACADGNAYALVYIDGSRVGDMFLNAGANVATSNSLSNLMVNVGAGDHTIQYNISLVSLNIC